MQCVACKTEVPEPSKFCNSCGRAVGSRSEETPTEYINSPASPQVTARRATATSSYMLSSDSSVEDGRFLPGTLLAERYRISALIGRGGMGEVYRATDLKLGQTVALKFLPEALSKEAPALQRFYNEVRVARQISHHNVCRVYDIGEAEGQAYISMEFVNGEDLGALLKRIGRLPVDKAMQMARQLCAGLGAAHEKGVLHRDLKPANIMIDSEGALHVMDFGLAGLAEQVAGDIRSGTPAYMAPEQLAGREVTLKSDIYSLGLVLYEMFTGKRPFNAASLDELQKMQADSSPESLATHVSDVDPTVERIIFRCLSASPQERPVSALAVSHALPGGDPLAAALAAGETPSPELVAAAAADSGLLPVNLAVACLGLLVLALLVTAGLGNKVTYVGASHIEHSPEYLAQTARDMLLNLGYDTKPFDRAYGFSEDFDYIQYHRQHTTADARWNDVESLRPGPMFFWYRESPVNMSGTIFGWNRGIGVGDPQPRIAGEIAVQMDMKGRLTTLEVVPPQLDDSPAATEPMTWDDLFNSAGLDISRFQPAKPQWTPLAALDTRAAWTGNFEETPEIPIRVEAASWHGKPIYFDVIGPWTRAIRQQKMTFSFEERVQRALGLTLITIVVLALILFGRANARAGRVDRRGAFRLGAFAFGVSFVSLLLFGHHQDGMDEIGFMIKVFANACFLGVLVWLLYLAVEPPVRRRWPQTMISWTRVLAGQLQDPLVASHVLAGLGAGAILTLLAMINTFFNIPLGDNPLDSYMLTLLGPRSAVGGIGQTLVAAPQAAMLSFFVLFLLRLVFRRDWLAALLYVLLFTSFTWFNIGNHFINLATALFSAALFPIILLRFGLLANVAMLFCHMVLIQVPLTLDLSSWRGDLTLLVGGILLGSALYCFRLALAHRRIFAGEL